MATHTPPPIQPSGCGALHQTDLATLPVCDAASAAALIIRVQQALQCAGIAHRVPPPLPTSCCGRGCNGCVWEGYCGAVQYWRDDAMAALSQHRAAPASEPNHRPAAE